MELKHCRAFVAVANHLHFTRAAEDIHVTQPTLTLLIQQLEQTVGAKLLIRNTRQVSLTEMGEEFLPLAKNVVQDADSAVRHMQNLASLSRGHVSVAAFPSVSANQLPPLIVEYRKKFPGITVRIRDGIWDSIIEDVRSGAADFGIASAPADSENFDFQHLYDDRVMLIAPEDHPWRNRKGVTWADIGEEEIILLSDNTGVRQSIDHALAGTGITLNSILEPALIQTTAALVAAGAGLGVILSSYQEVINQDRIITIPITQPEILRPVGLITRKTRELTPAARTLRDMTVDYFTAAP